jgi:predicted dehydrogenase
VSTALPPRTQARPRIGLVGCGNWGKNILRDLVALGASVVVVDRSSRGEVNARSGGADMVVENLEDMPDVDGAVIAVPASAHARVVDALIPRGFPLFVEKPLAVDAEACDRIVAAAAERVFVMDKWRYHPGIECLAAIARSGELGPVVGLETVRVGWGNPHSDVDGIWVLAPHDLSIALEILGQIPAPKAAVADRTSAGATGLTALLGEDPWLTLRVSTRSLHRQREVRLLCRGGVAVLGGGWEDHVELAIGNLEDGAEPVRERRRVSSELPLLLELQAFLRHLAGGRTPRSTAAEGAWTVRTIGELRRMAGING